jgi:hypothetical protein
MLTDVLIATTNRADSGQDQTIVLSNGPLKTTQQSLAYNDIISPSKKVAFSSTRVTRLLE